LDGRSRCGFCLVGSVLLRLNQKGKNCSDYHAHFVT
jgi:hypothetical protein